MKVYHISAENDHDATEGAFAAVAGIQAVGGTVVPAFNFESDETVPSVIVAILPDDVDPAQFFEGREIIHAGDLIEQPKEPEQEETKADDHEAEAERDGSGEDRREEGAGAGTGSEEAAS